MHVHVTAPADPLHRVDTAVEHAIGADMRLLYGMLVPILFICSLIIVLALSPSYLLVAVVLVPEVALLVFIVTKVVAMLNEPDDTDRVDQAAPGVPIRR